MSVEALFQKKSQKKKEEDGGKGIVDESTQLTDEGKKEIQQLIQDNNIVVFSKTYCPFCRQAKMTFNSIDGLEYKVIEMDDGNHNGWQAYIAEYAKDKAIPCAANTDTRSVPQIFIHQQYIGGADDLADLYTSKELTKLLGRDI